jgi:GtrA-like protein.
LAQAAAIAVIMVINYVLFKYFAFKQPKPQTRWEKILDFFNVFS